MPRAESATAVCDADLAFDPLDVENVILTLDRGRRGARRRVESPEAARAKDFGGRLFQAVFARETGELFRGAFREAEERGHGLRVRLQLSETPELANWPWEFLYDARQLDFFGVSTWTPIVRYVDSPNASRPVKVEGPLRILGLLSTPTDVAALDVQGERARLEGALAKAVTAESVTIDWLAPVSLRELDRQLLRSTYHVVHYIGHGAFFEDQEDGVLLFEDEHGRSERVNGASLAQHLSDHRSLRLCVLNACEGARTGIADPFSGVAASLVRRDMPAVIAMQFEISDDAALVFAEEFYLGLASGLPVDAAVACGRKAIHAESLGLEWGTPVLFLRVDDGRLFDVVDAPHVVALLEVSSEMPVGEAPQLLLKNRSPSQLVDLVLAAPDGRQLDFSGSLAPYEQRLVPWPAGADDQALAALPSAR